MTAAALESQVEELRAALDAMQAAAASRPRLHLTAVEAAPYLGQSVALIATVTQADGTPLAGVSVTMVTSWGELYGEDDPLEALTPREREVLALMAEGRSNSAIAGELVVTERAVEKHVTSIFSKLDLPAAREDHRRVLAVLTFLEA